MSVLRPKGKRKTYYYDFQHEGERHCQGGYKKYSEALAAQEAKRRELRNGTAITATVYFSQVANDYLDWANRKFIPKTYKQKVYVYKSFLKVVGDLPILEVNIDAMEKYLKTIPHNVTWERHRRELCALLRWAWKRRRYPEDICAFMEPMEREERYVPKVYTQEETIKILLAAGDLRVFFLALYSLAARVGEINKLRWQDVNFDKREVTLWTRKRTGVWRAQVKPMNKELCEELKRLYGKQSGEWVFPNPETSLPYVDRRKQIKRICRQANISYLGFHAIRHAVTSLLADTGKVSLPTLQKILGHSRKETTFKYMHRIGHGEREAAEFLKSPVASPANISGEAKSGGDEGT